MPRSTMSKATRAILRHPQSSGQRSMPLNNQQSRRWPAPLGDRVTDGADAEQVADAIVAIWLDIDQALHPIIGQRGVAALYNRTLHLTAVAYPWLAIDQPAVPAVMDPSGLRAALVQQAAAGGNALFQTFHELLASLVGASLTDRLLRSVWTHSSTGSPAQDTSS
jgi:hypothetical protein